MSESPEQTTEGCPFIGKKLQSAVQAAGEHIPLVDLKANYQSMQAEIDSKMSQVLSSCYFVGGPQCASFEKEFAEYCDSKYCIGVNSGTDALTLALKHFGVSEGDEVIVPGNTFIATALAVSAVGAKVVLADCDPETMLMDVTTLACRITPQTKAIIPVHLYGSCVDMDPLLELARSRDVLVVEDAAQAHGARYKGRRAGSMGDAGCFSFYPGKNLGAFGDGGAVVTNDERLAQQIRFWQNWGASKKYHHVVKGGNSRLDALQAAVLSAKLVRLDECNGRRSALAARYSELLEGVGDIRLPGTPRSVIPVWHLYVIRTEHRDRLLEHLNLEGIGASIHYPVPLPKLDAYKEELAEYATATDSPSGPIADETSSVSAKFDVRNALECSRTVLSLPMFPEMTEKQLGRVVDSVKRFFS